VVNKWKHIETSDKHMLNEWNRMVTNRKKNDLSTSPCP